MFLNYNPKYGYKNLKYIYIWNKKEVANSHFWEAESRGSYGKNKHVNIYIIYYYHY